MLDETRSNLVGLTQNFSFKACDIQDIPEADETFDAVIANHMLYHVPDRAKAISELHRVLKSGGLLLAATNGENHMVELAELVQQFDPKYMSTRGGESFGLENGARQLEEFFSDVELFPFDSNLIVTEVEPIVAYVLSSNLPTIHEKRQSFTRECERVLEKGPFHITKTPGLFRARKST